MLKSDIQKRKTNHKKQLAVIFLAALLIGTAAAASGCSGPSLPSLGGKYVFKMGSEKCPEKEAKIILMSYQKDYSSFYGIDMWSGEYEDGNSLEDYVKELAISQLAQVYTLDIIAGEQEFVLSEEETAETEAAAKEFMEGLDDAEQEYLGVSEGDVQNLYERYLLAEKLYTSLTESVSSEVSDDEARVMDMKQICVSDEDTADEIVSRLASGADFSAMAEDYNESSVTDLHVTRTTYDTEVSDQLFALGTGDFSNVISMDGSYYIFYCVNTFNETLTQENKESVLTRRMEDAVNSVYTSYTNQLDSELNEKVWGDVRVDTSLPLEGSSFLEIYNEYFGSSF